MELESVTDKQEKTEECRVTIVSEAELASILTSEGLADVDCTRLDVIEPRAVEKSATGKDNAPVTAGVGGQMGKGGTKALDKGGPIELPGTPLTQEQIKDAAGIAELGDNSVAQAEANESENQSTPRKDENGADR